MCSQGSTAQGNTAVYWLKALSSIGLGAVAALYILGFLTHAVYYRLLGIDVGAQPLTYLTFAGDYISSVFVSIPQLFTLFPVYVHELTDAWLWFPLGICVVGIAVVIILDHNRKSYLLKVAVCLLLGIAGFLILRSELNVLAVHTVLHPFSPIDSRESNPAPSQRSGEKMIAQIGTAYREHERLGQADSGFKQWSRWFDPLSPSSQKARSDSYLALLLVNVLFVAFLATAFLLTAFRLQSEKKYSRIIYVETVMGLIMVLLLLPCVYASLGRVFSYPVVQMTLEGASNVNAEREETHQPVDGKTSVPDQTPASTRVITHPVFLVFQDETEIVVYDRLNSFKLKRIPRSRILSLNELYYASPFDNCSRYQGMFDPCESLWLKNTPLISDF